MADIFSPQKRHQVMSSIRSKNSRAELMVFSYLRKNKVYFQKHYSRVSGKPDIALPRKKKACFIDGDFWHGRSLDDLILKRGVDDYWTKKIMRNIERDKEQRQFLKESGWEVLVIWESDINRKSTRELTFATIKDFLN